MENQILDDYLSSENYKIHEWIIMGFFLCMLIQIVDAFSKIFITESMLILGANNYIFLCSNYFLPIFITSFLIIISRDKILSLVISKRWEFWNIFIFASIALFLLNIYIHVHYSIGEDFINNLFGVSERRQAYSIFLFGENINTYLRTLIYSFKFILYTYLMYSNKPVV